MAGRAEPRARGVAPLRLHRVRSAWARLWGNEPRFGVAAVLLLLVVLVSVGSFLLTQGGSKHPVPYMAGDSRVLLPDRRPAPRSLSIAEALKIRPQHARFVRGYLSAPLDDVPRLCTRFSDTACAGPSLVIANLRWVDAVPAIKGLRHGCCSVGYWTPEQLALQGTLEGHTLRLDQRSPAASLATSCRAGSAGNKSESRLLGHAAGDLDGDGRVEEVSIRANDRLPVRCRYLLVVRQGRRVRTRPVFAPLPDAAAQGYEPYLVGLAAVAQGRGLQAIVDSNCCGAYVNGQWLFRERRGGLSLMQVRPTDTLVPNTFGNGASVCCGETPVCGRHRGVVLEFGEGRYARPVEDADVFVQRGDSFIRTGRERLRRPGNLEDFENCRPWTRARK